MTTLLKLAATALLSWAAAAPALAAPPANLNITSARGQAFSLVLDGRMLTRPLARQVHVDLLAPGRHWADISVPTAYGPPMRFRTAVWLAPGSETSYVLLVSPYGPQLRQVSAVALGQPAYGPGGGYPGGGYPQQPGGYYGGPAGQAQGQGSYPQPQPQPQGGYYDNGQPSPPPSSQGSYPTPNNGQYDNGYGNQGGYPSNGQNGNGSYPNNAPNSNGNYPNSRQNGNSSLPQNSYPAPADGQYDAGNAAPVNPNAPVYTPPAAPSQQGSYPAPNDGYNPGANNSASLSPLSPEDAADLVDAMRKQPSDDERLDMAKQTLDQNSVRSEDLAEMLRTFGAEEARVELAEFGYAHVTDPQNFGRVYDTFQSRDSVREVQQALGIQR